MSQAARAARECFTRDDYRSRPDDERWEIVGGEAFAMTPAPFLNSRGSAYTPTAKAQRQTRIPAGAKALESGGNPGHDAGDDRHRGANFP